MKLLFKILGCLFALLFIYSTLVQYNDPDAMQWYLYYGVATLASILFVFNGLKMQWAFLLFLFFAFKMYQVWPDTYEGITIGEGDIQNIEEGREALGLGICALAMLIYTLRTWFVKKSKI